MSGLRNSVQGVKPHLARESPVSITVCFEVESPNVHFEMSSLDEKAVGPGQRATAPCKPKSAPLSSVLQLGTTWAGRFRRDCALSTAANTCCCVAKSEISMGAELDADAVSVTANGTIEELARKRPSVANSRPLWSGRGALFEGVPKCAHSCAASVVLREPGAPLMTALARFLRSGE